MDVRIPVENSTDLGNEPPFVTDALARKWKCFRSPEADPMVVDATRHCFEVARLLLHHDEKRAVISPFLAFLESVYEDLLGLEHDVLLSQATPGGNGLNELKEVQRIYATLLQKRLERKQADLHLVRKYVATAPIDELYEVARYSISDEDSEVAERVREAVEDEEQYCRELAQSQLDFAQGANQEPFAKHPDYEPAQVWIRLTASVDRFYNALLQRDAKTSLADPSLADFSLTSPLASQLFSEALDHVILETSSLFDPSPSGFAVAAPVVPESLGSWWGIVEAPVISDRPLSESYTRAIHEVGHWADMRLHFVDMVEKTERLEQLSDRHQGYLIELMSEVLPDAFAVAVGYGAANADKYCDALFRTLAKHLAEALPQDGINEMDEETAAARVTRMARVLALYLLVRRARLLADSPGPKGIPYFLIGRDAPAEEIRTAVYDLWGEATDWLNDKAKAALLGKEATRSLGYLAQVFKQQKETTWYDVAPIVPTVAHLVYLSLHVLRYTVLVLKARRSHMVGKGRLRREQDLRGIQLGRPVAPAITVAEFAAYMDALQDAERFASDISMRATAANLLSMVAST